MMRYAHVVPNKWCGLLARFFDEVYAVPIDCFVINYTPSKLGWSFSPASAF
jgi:hypothetical protein